MKYLNLTFMVLGFLCLCLPVTAADAPTASKQATYTILRSAGAVSIDGKQIRKGETVSPGSYITTGAGGRLTVSRGTHSLMAFAPNSEGRLDDGLRLYKGAAVVSSQCSAADVSTQKDEARLCGEIYFAADTNESVMCLAPHSSLTMAGTRLQTTDAAACYVLQDSAPALKELPDASMLAILRGRISGPGKVPGMFEIAGVTAAGDDAESDGGASGLLVDDEGNGDSGEDSAAGGGESLCLEGGDASGASGDNNNQGTETEIEQGYSRVIIHVVFED